MHYTMADFLQDNIVPGTHLLTKTLDFRNIIIESISVLELPIQNFPQKNELVLSTAMGCQEDESLFLHFLQEIQRAHASALLLTFQDETISVPQSLIDYANSKDFPVFLIPWKHRFATIQRDVIEKIQSKKLEIYQNLQSTLFGMFFDSRPLDDAMNAIAKTFGFLVSVTDKDHQLQAKCTWPSKSTAHDMPYMEVPIHIGKSLAGYLCFCLPENGTEFSIDRVVLDKYVCFPLSLWFNRKNMDDLLIMKLKDDFVWNLAHGNYTSFEDMVRHGRGLHFDLKKPYTCIILKAVANTSGTSLQQYSNEAAVNAADIENLLIDTGKSSSLSLMVGERSLEFIIYVANQPHDSIMAVESLLDDLDEQLKHAFPSYEFYWGISEITLKKPDFGRLYKNAALALQRCLNSNRKKYRCTYQDTKEAQIISCLSSHEEIQQMVRETMSALQEYDATSGMDLLGTLTEYFKCNYNMSQTARNLHIHRQSLLYRLQKIEDLTKTSMNDHRDLFLLELCTLILFG